MGYKPKQLREMSELQLQKTLYDLQGELRKLRFLAGHGELKKVHQIKDIKKSIARVKSEIRAREMKGDTQSVSPQNQDSPAADEEKVAA